MAYGGAAASRLEYRIKRLTVEEKHRLVADPLFVSQPEGLSECGTYLLDLARHHRADPALWPLRRSGVFLGWDEVDLG